MNVFVGPFFEEIVDISCLFATSYNYPLSRRIHCKSSFITEISIANSDLTRNTRRLRERERERERERDTMTLTLAIALQGYTISKTLEENITTKES